MILTTIPPFSPHVAPQQENVLLDAQQRRLLINQELRRFEWVVDLDPWLLGNDGGFKEIYDFGDHLHLNTVGGMVAAQAIMQKLSQLGYDKRF